VPLRSGTEAIGVLALQSYDPRITFDERHREMLGFVASQVAMAIDRKRREEQIEWMAFYDGLTGLYNRRMLQERAQQSLEIARRHQWSTAFLYLDLDRFKNVNDTLGHDAGDELLALIGGELRGWLRASDTLARIGGDEFAFVLNSADERRAAEAAQRILGVLDRPFMLRGQRVHIGASIGIALFPQHGGTFDELLKHADIAMYRAKADGGCFRFFDPTSTPVSRERIALEAELREALAAGGLELHYQPLRTLADGALVGFEGLARWRRHEGILDAAQFVPMAEESDLVRLLDWQLLQRAMREARVLLPSDSTLQMATNLSARSLHSPGLVEHLATILHETGIPPERVVLEVTENAALSDPARCSRTLYALAGLGVRLALDDFGTRYASLTCLCSMPFHSVKIDGSLIREIGNDPRAEELVQGAISLGHGLGLEVVGEGVESEAQRDWLRGRGCDLAQGRLIGPPVAADELRGASGAAT
jgi:diguanylate cyclase (GGDEF)-like protein